MKNNREQHSIFPTSSGKVTLHLARCGVVGCKVQVREGHGGYVVILLPEVPRYPLKYSTDTPIQNARKSEHSPYSVLPLFA